MTVVGGANDMADKADGAVYLVLMKGDFTSLRRRLRAVVCPGADRALLFGHRGRRPTSVTLEAGLGNRPPPVPLQALGPVLHLT